MRLAAIGAASLAFAVPHGAAQHGTAPTPAPAPAPGGQDAPSTTQTTRVGMGFATFLPARVDVVTGDTVRWENTSIRPHTVTAQDDSFDSGRLVAGQTFARTPSVPGTIPYLCTLHPGMTGEVRVHDVLLRGPAGAVAPGRAFPLRGRTALPAGSPVSIEADSGTGFAPVAQAAVAADGTFTATVTPSTSATYRAVVAERTSAPVTIAALDREVHASVRRTGRRLTVDVRVMPASPGQTVVLQLRLKHRFGWWPVQVARLDRRSRARLTTPLGSAPPARVLLTLPDRATALASSGTLSTRR